ncbi:hypothetical protein DSO57_1027242 [Entomophthora muscae]|uniref:Uncharacterized protein n=1 Tax=Entomophthora muscae TaxID=34485 RepID=A0ACC2RSS5_9FUNG|nr:hypothetical protein DSO57_1027242 [Entomophthora muscae]
MPAFCHHELIMRAANSTNNLSLASNLLTPLKEMELWGDEVRSKIMRFTRHFVSRPHTKDIPQCSICHEFCFLLSVTCHCQGDSGQIACLEHTPDLCECQLSERILIEHVSQAEIERTTARLIHLSNPGAAWAKRCASILRDEQHPRLSQLRAMVADARALPFTPPEEACQLSKFTDTCLTWKGRVDMVLQAYTSKEPDDLSQLPPPNQLASHIQSLLDQARTLPVQFEEMEHFVTLGYWVNSFCSSARILLSNPAATLDRANELQNQGAQLGLVFDETEQLDRLVDQLQWCEDARALVSSGGDISRQAEKLLAAAPQPPSSQMNEWVATLRTHLPHQPTPKTSSPIRTPNSNRIPPPIAPQAPPPVEDGLIATARYLLDLSRSPNFNARPSTAKLYPIMDRIKNLNRTEAPFQELRQAYVDVDHWFKKSLALLTSKSSLGQGSLLAQLSKALDQMRTHSSGKGYFGCICFKAGTEGIPTAVCQVCSVIYHTHCVQPQIDASGLYTCPICSPGTYRPIRSGRPCSSNLVSLIQSGTLLPFIPAELNSMIELSKLIETLAAQSMALVQDSRAKLDNLKDQLRLLEGLDFALEDESQALHRRIMCVYPPMASRPTLPPASSLLQITENSAKRLCTTQALPLPSSNPQRVSHSPHTSSQHLGYAPQHMQYTQVAPSLPSQPHHRQPSHSPHVPQNHTSYSSQHPSYTARTQTHQRLPPYPPQDNLSSRPHLELDAVPPRHPPPGNPFSIENLIGPDSKDSSHKPLHPPEASDTRVTSPNPYSSRYLPSLTNTSSRYPSQTAPHGHHHQAPRPASHHQSHPHHQTRPMMVYNHNPQMGRVPMAPSNGREHSHQTDVPHRESSMHSSSHQPPQYYSRSMTSHQLSMPPIHSGSRPMGMYPPQSRPGQYRSSSTHHGQHPLYGGTSANPHGSRPLIPSNPQTIIAPHLRPPPSNGPPTENPKPAYQS